MLPTFPSFNLCLYLCLRILAVPRALAIPLSLSRRTPYPFPAFAPRNPIPSSAPSKEKTKKKIKNHHLHSVHDMSSSRSTQQHHQQQPPPHHRTTTASGMRRNLFNSNLSRRPPTTGPAPIAGSPAMPGAPPGPSSTSATSATTLQLADDHEHPAETHQDRDIVARDEEGNFRLEMPMTVGAAGILRDEAREEREVECRLIETYRKHQQHIEPGGRWHTFFSFPPSLRAR